MEHTERDRRLEVLVRSHVKDLLSWALHKTGDRMQAEDLVQETFLAAAEGLHRFEGKSEAKTWLFAILNNKIAEHYRRSSRFLSVPLDDPDRLSRDFDEQEHWRKDAITGPWDDDPHLLDDASFLAVLRDCLDRLPMEWNRCISLKYLKEKEAKEICQETGLSSTNYWQIVHRAKLQLRRCLDRNWFAAQEE